MQLVEFPKDLLKKLNFANVNGGDILLRKQLLGFHGISRQLLMWNWCSASHEKLIQKDKFGERARRKLKLEAAGEWQHVLHFYNSEKWRRD